MLVAHSLLIQNTSNSKLQTIAAFDKVDDIVQTWNDLFLKIVNKHAPIKTNRVKRKHQPEWLTSEILDLMKERDKCKINGKIDEYRILRNKISKMIDKAKKEMYRNKLEEGQDDPRTIWKIFKQFGACLQKMESTENAFGIKIDEQVITNEQMIAGPFNEFF